MIARKWWTLIAVCMGTFMLLLDVSIVNVALPAIERDLEASFSDLQWVVNAYALTLAAFLLTGGSLADRLGRRLMFVVGLAIFTVASLLCGLASDPLFLNVSRGLQGVGGAIMFATALALIGESFAGRERGTAIGLWGATIGAALAIGPLVGGVLTEAFGWEWIFFVNIPIGALVIAMTLLKVAESRNPEAGRIDWLGLVTFSAALAMLVYALIKGNELGWGSTTIVALLIGSAVLLAAFLVVERRRPDPMLDLTLFRKPAFAGGAIAAVAMHGSIIALFLFITLYFQNILGYSPLETGLRFLPVTLVAFLVSPITGRLAGRIPVRVVLATGLLAIAVGCIVGRGLTADDDWTALLPAMLLAGVGVGIMNPAIATTAIGVVEAARGGMASGINNTFRQLGLAIGVAVLGAVFQSRIENRVGELLAGDPVGAGGRAERIAEAVASGGGGEAINAAPPEAREAIAGAARDAFIFGLNDILELAAVVAFVGGVLALLLVRTRDFVPSAAERMPEPVIAGEGTPAAG